MKHIPVIKDLPSVKGCGVGSNRGRGVVLVTVALLLGVLLGMGALAVDVSSLFVVKNELQNAADAGALAATRVLYLPDGSLVNAGANTVGVTAATANTAQNVQVELVGDPSNNAGDVQRGHWRWSDHSFTPNDSLLPVSLFNVSSAELDADLNFINAVRVRTRRQNVPAQSFLSTVLGFNDFPMQAEAVAYVGFAGTLLEDEADQPIAICQQSLLNVDGEYSCSTGRMINSGTDHTGKNTGGWTNFTQDPCSTASTPTVRPYVGCNPTDAPEISFGADMGTTGGEIQNVFDDYFNCWLTSADTNGDGRPDTVRNLTLPVIDCPSNNVGPCAEVVGAVNVNMVWMIRQTDPGFDWVPLEMTGPAGFPDWACPAAITQGLPADQLSDEQFLNCWSDFAVHFNLLNYQEISIATLPLVDLNKSMFFLPDCDAHIPTGGTGGRNFGVLAKIPVLVQ